MIKNNFYKINKSKNNFNEIETYFLDFKESKYKYKVTVTEHHFQLKVIQAYCLSKQGQKIANIKALYFFNYSELEIQNSFVLKEFRNKGFGTKVYSLLYGFILEKFGNFTSINKSGCSTAAGFVHKKLSKKFNFNFKENFNKKVEVKAFDSGHGPYKYRVEILDPKNRKC